MDPLTRLNRVRDIKHEMQRLFSKVEELETLATKITQTISPAPVQGGSHTKDDVWAKLIDYKLTCSVRIDEYLTASKELSDELSFIKSGRIRAAMKYRYVDGLSTEAIAEKMHYDIRSIYYFLKKGKELYCEEYKDD